MAELIVEADILVLEDNISGPVKNWCKSQVLGFTEQLNMATLKLQGVPPKKASNVRDLTTECHRAIDGSILMNMLPYQVQYHHVSADVYVHQVLNLDCADINPDRNLTKRGGTATMNAISTSCGFKESMEYILAVVGKHADRKFVVILPMPSSEEINLTKLTLKEHSETLLDVTATERLDIIVFVDSSYRYIYEDKTHSKGVHFKGTSAIDAFDYAFAGFRQYFIVASGISMSELPLFFKTVYGSCTTHDESYQSRYEIDVRALLPQFLSAANFDILTKNIYCSQINDVRIGCNSKTINFAYVGNGAEITLVFVIDCLDTRVSPPISYPEQSLVDTIHAALHKDGDANKLQILYTMNDCKDENLLSFKWIVTQFLFSQFFVNSNIHVGQRVAPPLLKRPTAARVASER